MSKEVESYKLGNIRVIISETEDPTRLHVDCNDGVYHSDFTVRLYEYQHYKRHLNQRITTAYKKQYDTEEDDTGSSWTE
ncbi:MAG: hypothetical protein EA359_00455 [Balneolaceae bacterium]|nr:MAG: hypothetical protein EA359_00455 [Balneolaceae bacterium]